MRTFVILLIGITLALTEGGQDVVKGTQDETDLINEEEEEEEGCASDDGVQGLGCHSCRDDVQSCLFFRLAGLCTDPEVYKQCEFSCSVCSCGDNARNCVDELKVRSCSDTWMITHCKQTCGRCTCKDNYSASYCKQVTQRNDDRYNCFRSGERCAASCGHCTCEDTVADCAVRAEWGECVIHMRYMMKHCKASCNQCNGACVDNLNDCAVWVTRNPHACHANPGFMNIHCAASCKICTPEVVPTEVVPTEVEPTEVEPTEEVGECVDQEDACVLAARTGDCLKPEIRRKCPFSCRQCVCGDLDQRCEAWSEEGKCYTDVKMMMINCRQTCEFCQCQDKAGHTVKCLLLAAQGKCAEDPANLVTCPLSCNVCECGDNAGNCVVDALAGKCQSNPSYMLTHCAESCHQCNICGDNPPFEGKICSTALQRGYCETEPLFRIHCAKTCGVCSEENDGGSSSEDEGPDPKPDPDPRPWRNI